MASMTTEPRVYRFGALRFTLNEINAAGFRHGEDGIMYYPPAVWGMNVPTPTSNPIPTPGSQWLATDLAYHHGYVAGYYARHGH